MKKEYPMNRKTWQETVKALPVFDTHTHLNKPGVPIPAQSFWDIAHYFWFQQELWSAGYPSNASKLPEEDRVEAFVKAFNAVRNTVWHLIVRHICKDLYDVSLTDQNGRATPDRVREVDAAIRASSQQSGWSRSVIDRLAIRRITVNNVEDSKFPGLTGVSVCVPTWNALPEWSDRLVKSTRPIWSLEEAKTAMETAIAGFYDQGIRGVRVAADIFETHRKPAVERLDPPESQTLERWQADALLTHRLLDVLGKHGMFAQFFLGIERDVTPHTAMAVNDPRRIINLYPLFEVHGCDFELVVGAPQNNMDAAQAARIYPNVHAGGLWWYNFRNSTYRHAMQVRFEAVPASKSALIASDARCIEWCYGKILLVKRLLADFLYDQMDRGWIDETDAIWVAREWLHDAAVRRYV
jgi:glucuronate isomerase